MRRAEGLVGSVVLLVVMALALLLSGCGDAKDVVFKKRRAEAFTECEIYCRATPLAVKFDYDGTLMECRCDIVFAEVE